MTELPIISRSGDATVTVRRKPAVPAHTVADPQQGTTQFFEAVPAGVTVEIAFVSSLVTIDLVGSISRSVVEAGGRDGIKEQVMKKLREDLGRRLSPVEMMAAHINVAWPVSRAIRGALDAAAAAGILVRA